jgi:DnaJ-class molecular chaperone
VTTHYETLGVDRSATDDEIRAAFMALAKKHHPDALVTVIRNRKVVSGSRAQAARDFTDMSAAYSVLKDPAKRKAYDAELALLYPPCGACEGKGRTYRSKGFTGRVATTCSACNGSGIQKPTASKERKKK